MATRIIEYGGGDRIDRLPVVPDDGTSQTKMTAGAAAQSAAFANGTNLICIQSDEAIHIKRGSNPVATTDNYKLQAGTEQFFSVKPGQKVSILLAS